MVGDDEDVVTELQILLAAIVQDATADEAGVSVKEPVTEMVPVPTLRTVSCKISPVPSELLLNASVVCDPAAGTVGPLDHEVTPYPAAKKNSLLSAATALLAVTDGLFKLVANAEEPKAKSRHTSATQVSVSCGIFPNEMELVASDVATPVHALT